MPRPNPPRKRPRRPAGDRVRADTQLNKQTAQSAQPGGPGGGKPSSPRPDKPGPPTRGDKSAAADAAATPPELWSRRSYAITIGLLAAVEVVLTAIQWALAPASGSNGVKAPALEALVGLNPISLLVAGLIAPMLARPLTGERRALRPVESLLLGVFAFFIYVYVALAAGFLLRGSAPSTATPRATPCVSACSTVSSPGASAAASGSAAATPTAAASPSTGASASASAGTSPNPSGNIVSQQGPFTAADAGANVAVDVVTFVLTLFIYPPLYKRLRIRPRPPRQRPPPREKQK